MEYPKGEPEANESIFEAAKREFEEETGMKPYGPYINLGDIVQKMEKGYLHGVLREVAHW